jgi:hypothetical protein
MNSVDLKWLCFLHIWKETKEGRKEGSEGGRGGEGRTFLLSKFQVVKLIRKLWYTTPSSDGDCRYFFKFQELWCLYLHVTADDVRKDQLRNK